MSSTGRLVTRFGADPLQDLEVANKRYVDTSGGGATLTTQRIYLTSDFTTTSLVDVDVTAITITLASRAGGGFFATIQSCARNSSAAAFYWILLANAANTRLAEGAVSQAVTANETLQLGQGLSGDLDGSVIKMRCRTSSATLTISSLEDVNSGIEVLEAS